VFKNQLLAKVDVPQPKEGVPKCLISSDPIEQYIQGMYRYHLLAKADIPIPRTGYQDECATLLTVARICPFLLICASNCFLALISRSSRSLVVAMTFPSIRVVRLFSLKNTNLLFYSVF